MDIEDKIKAIRTVWLMLMQAEIEDIEAELSSICESPIERLMGLRLLLLNCGYGPRWRLNLLWSYGSPEAGPEGGLALQQFQVAVVPQWEVGDYRADFLVLFAVPNSRSGGVTIKRYVVECDGHEFHEKTKKQAARDKARDRFFGSLGCHVFRYSGSEIFANADNMLRDLQMAMAEAVEEGVGS